MAQLKVAVIGCGYWGKNLVRNFSELGVLSALCDDNQALVQQLSETYQTPILSLEAVLAGSCDAVVIATPAVQHASLAEQALRAGKHVFVEKPLSLKVEDAEKLKRLAKKQGKVLMVGHLLQYHQAFLTLKEMIEAGRLGRLQYVYSNRLNLGKVRTEENILWSFAPHDISMILALVGRLPESVYATGACHLNPDIQDVTTTHLKFKNGIQAHVFVSWLHPYKEQKLIVIGDKGMALFDDSLPWEEKLSLYPHQVAWRQGQPFPEKAEGFFIPLEKQEPLKAECQHFIDCIEQGRKPRTDADEAIQVLQVLKMAETSLKTQALVKQATAPLPYFVHETAVVDARAEIEAGTKIWHFSHIMAGAEIGKNCTIGQNVMIGPDVKVGDACKIQNNVSLYKGVVLESGVFCGPSCVFTNVNTPRAEIERKDAFLLTHVEKGVSIGANATIVCGNRLGRYSLIGAGAVVTKPVKPHALMVGNPARQLGWVSHAGERLGEDLVCPREGRRYQVLDDELIEIEKNDSTVALSS